MARWRTAVLAAFFPALALSISASQTLLAVLVFLAVPWRRVVAASRESRSGTRALAAAWRETQPLRDHPLTRPFLIFGALSVLSAGLSGNPGHSLWTARDLLLVSTFYVVWTQTRDARHAAVVWRGFLIAITVMAGYGLAQASICPTRVHLLPAALRGEVCVHPERVSGPFSIYMTFGGILLLTALYCLAHLANLPLRRVWWMMPMSGLVLIALVLTQSRNAWVGLIAGTLGLVATARRARQILLALLTAALLIAVMAPEPLVGRVRPMMALQDESSRDRLAMWRSGLAIIADHPLFGVGPGEVRAWYPHYRRPEAVRPSTGHLHNSPIQLAAERGLPALAAWLWIWVVFFRHGGEILRRTGRDRPAARALVSASLAGVGGFLVAGLFEYNVGDSEVVMVVYALMALPFVVARSVPPDLRDPVPIIVEHACAWLRPRTPWWSRGTAHHHGRTMPPRPGSLWTAPRPGSPPMPSTAACPAPTQAPRVGNPGSRTSGPA